MLENRVFLGGTCNGSNWRVLPETYFKHWNIEFFNPVVEDWNEEAYKEELRQREVCKYLLYVITPRMTGVYAIAEIVDDSNKRPERVIFTFLEEDEADLDSKEYLLKFDKHQIKSLEKVGKMVEDNGGKFFNSLHEAMLYICKDSRE